MQYFKGDETELKFVAGAGDALDTVSIVKDSFYEECYACFILGEVISDNALSPLSNAIVRPIFRESFVELFAAFEAVGTADAYLTVFAQIFGTTAVVTFTVPAAGKLQIDIAAGEIELSEFRARYIEDNRYIFDEVIDEDLDNIVFQTVKGFPSQYELELMLKEMVPEGVFTEITLTLGA